jgi:hypothetical protein
MGFGSRVQQEEQKGKIVAPQIFITPKPTQSKTHFVMIHISIKRGRGKHPPLLDGLCIGEEYGTDICHMTEYKLTHVT